MSRGCAGENQKKQYDRAKNSEKCYNDTHDEGL